MTHTHLTRLSRALFLVWLMDEAVCYYHRNDPEAATHNTENPRSALFLAVPFLWVARLPRPLRLLGIVLQAISLITMVGARRQLIAARSFGWSAQAGTQPQRDGWYAALEHPIYLSMITHILGWSATNPIAILALPGLLHAYFSRQVTAERTHLASLGTIHRGIDSGLWDRMCAEPRSCAAGHGSRARRQPILHDPPR
jgi:hypothetical protein